uniref:Uncharacterized protein n=1 Tax=Coccidioides posadasii RMSCC 3488 TaxID=454284 RepID=A0A0J6FPB7_COCPO|nr:hypothetical protein CPAG_07135 [Coccidioides posadasii RMSCC 3488]
MPLFVTDEIWSRRLSPFMQKWNKGRQKSKREKRVHSQLTTLKGAHQIGATASTRPETAASARSGVAPSVSGLARAGPRWVLMWSGAGPVRAWCQPASHLDSPTSSVTTI